MTTDHHPITPTPELRWLWVGNAQRMNPRNTVEWLPRYCVEWLEHVANQATCWGADQQLKAVCEWLAQETPEPYIAALRAAMRPKPPSLAEKALTKIDAILGDPQKSTLKDELEALELSRAALERLQELETHQ